MKVTTRIGHLDDPRIKKIANGQYVAKGIQGMFKTWIAAFEALDDQCRRDLKELQNFHK
jgi:hypothetical protein